MARRPRDWDKVNREKRVRASGSLPYWQDGWTSCLEQSGGNREFILAFDLDGGCSENVDGKERTVFREEYVIIGISKIIWDYILEPTRPVPTATDLKDETFQKEFIQRVQRTLRRLTEKTYFCGQTFQNGVIKRMYRKKTHPLNGPRRPKNIAPSFSTIVLDPKVVETYFRNWRIAYDPTKSIASQLRVFVKNEHPDWNAKQIKTAVDGYLAQLRPVR